MLEATPSTITLKIEDHGTTAVVHCSGKLLGPASGQLYRAVSELIPTHAHITLDLCDLTAMDSLGLGTLVRLYAAAKAKHHQLELRNLGKKVRELLIMTNLISVFSIVGEQGMHMQ